MKRISIIILVLLFNCYTSTEWQELNLDLPKGYPKITYLNKNINSTDVDSEQKRRLIINNKTEIDFPIHMSVKGSIEIYSINESLLYFQEESNGFSLDLKSYEVLELDLISDSTLFLLGKIISQNNQSLEFIRAY